MALDYYDLGQAGRTTTKKLADVGKNIVKGLNSTIDKYRPKENGGDDYLEDGGTKADTGSSSSTYNPQQALVDAYRQRMNDAREATLNSINLRLQNGIGQYEQQLKDATDQYQALRNQSEVERYKTRASMREALANRGQLDSGLGRQETLELNTKFGNAINNINLQEQAYNNSIRNAITQLRAEAEAEKAAANNQYNSSLAELMASL